MAIDVGTIGNRKCEVNLNKILMELGNENIAGFIVSTLVKFRLGLRQLKHVPDKSWRFTFINQLHKEFINKINSKQLPAAVHSHTLCCMMAYYRDAKHEDIRSDADFVGD